MVLFPNAKINIGLYITEKRADGFHNIETIFYPIPSLCDILEVIVTPNQNDPIVFSQSGIAVDGVFSNNLCVKAYNILNNHTHLPPVAMHLHKQIPIGAGLGGGSADGAFALTMLNSLASKPLSLSTLCEVALELGSDCPFFLQNKPCFGTGRGEILEPIEMSLKGYHILIVNPGVHVNTGFAYKSSKPAKAGFNLKRIHKYPVEEWQNLITNDFEKTIFGLHPVIEELKNQMYCMGAVYASMSGSGSTVFGLFKDKPKSDNQFQNYFTHIGEM